MSDWLARLRQASFRGVPFGVLSSERPVGRRLAVHEYPYRDDPFVEDMGRATRRISFRGFLLEDSVAYAGGPIDLQNALMTAAAEAQGSGLLIHPLLGPLLVNVERMTPSERWDAGRYIELAFELVVTGSSLFGIPVLDTVSGVLAAADGAVSLLSSLFGADADSYVASGANVGDPSSVAAAFSSSAVALGGGVAGVFSLSGSAAAGSAALTFASGGLLEASAGLGLSEGAGLATAAAATSVVRTVSGLSDPGAAMDNMSSLAADFGDDGE